MKFINDKILDELGLTNYEKKKILEELMRIKNYTSNRVSLYGLTEGEKNELIKLSNIIKNLIELGDLKKGSQFLNDKLEVLPMFKKAQEKSYKIFKDELESVVSILSRIYENNDINEILGVIDEIKEANKNSYYFSSIEKTSGYTNINVKRSCYDVLILSNEPGYKPEYDQIVKYYVEGKYFIDGCTPVGVFWEVQCYEEFNKMSYYISNNSTPLYKLNKSINDYKELLKLRDFVISSCTTKISDDDYYFWSDVNENYYDSNMKEQFELIKNDSIKGYEKSAKYCDIYLEKINSVIRNLIFDSIEFVKQIDIKRRHEQVIDSLDKIYTESYEKVQVINEVSNESNIDTIMDSDYICHLIDSLYPNTTNSLKDATKTMDKTKLEECYNNIINILLLDDSYGYSDDDLIYDSSADNFVLKK